jgi:hypothetical protein
VFPPPPPPIFSRLIPLFLSIILIFALVFTSCSNGSTGGGGSGGGGNGGGNTGGNTGGTVVRFNLTGAKAIAAVQGGLENGRAVNGSGNGLFKLLENDSFESIVSGNYEIPDIQFLARSPVEGKKDIYISFLNRWRTDNGTVGSFIHVKEDGSVVNILEGWDSIEIAYLWNIVGQDTSPVAFDQYGNMYFRVRGSNNSNSIYKYNPVTGKKEQLVPAVSNIWYGKIVVSSDGSYLIVEGHRYRSNRFLDLDVSFVRIIPSANPQNMVDHITVFWEEGKGDGNLSGYSPYSLAYVFGRRNELYVSGNTIFGDENKNGFYKVSFEDLSPDDWQWEKLFDASENGYSFDSIDFLVVAPDNSIWGNYNGFIARIINSNGQPFFYRPADNVCAGTPRPSASHLYFIGYEEYRPYDPLLWNIYRVSYSNPTSAQNVLSGITTRNAKNIWVFDYDIGGDYLYFNAVENPLYTDNILTGDFFNGKINLTTLEYTELEFSWNITAIVAY